MLRDLSELNHRGADWAGLRVLVAGLGVSGFAAADALLQRGSTVLVVDAATPAPESAMAQRARILETLGATLAFGPDAVAGMPPVQIDLVLTSPGWPPTAALLTSASAAGVPIWGDVELAWRLRPRVGAAPWLTITGTNGKTTTVQMLASILHDAGLRTIAVGNVGTPILEAVMDPEPFDVIAVELSSFQLHWSDSIRAQASVCLNLAPDHTDWHGDYDAYVAAKAKIYERTQVACIYNVEDVATRTLVEEAEVQEGCRAIGFTLGTPAPSMLGVVDDVLADRAFVQQRQHAAAELATLADLSRDGAPAPPHLIANALAAAALARAHGVPPAAVRAGLRSFELDAHRGAIVAAGDGIRWVDDSKATNPHAAAAALAAHESIVWVAGGLLKGAAVDGLIKGAASRLRGVVLLGADRAAFAQALARHAPNVPVIEVVQTDTKAMDEVVSAAASLAQPADTVLLAPAAASLDMFDSYGARGDAFAEAVRHHAGEMR